MYVARPMLPTSYDILSYQVLVRNIPVELCTSRSGVQAVLLTLCIMTAIHSGQGYHRAVIGNLSFVIEKKEVTSFTTHFLLVATKELHWPTLAAELAVDNECETAICNV